MSAIKVIGIDLGKSTFHLVATIIVVVNNIGTNYLEVNYYSLSLCMNQH